jgi:hypothetical protein
MDGGSAESAGASFSAGDARFSEVRTSPAVYITNTNIPFGGHAPASGVDATEPGDFYLIAPNRVIFQAPLLAQWTLRRLAFIRRVSSL